MIIQIEGDEWQYRLNLDTFDILLQYYQKLFKSFHMVIHIYYSRVY